ncbi:hypothetical protein XH87_25830 [Bradyrhizobium sp. CCBAU 53415]|nr:hypothetical protein [Bradyrhizobium sp. CCBAU 53415]
MRSFKAKDGRGFKSLPRYQSYDFVRQITISCDFVLPLGSSADLLRQAWKPVSSAPSFGCDARRSFAGAVLAVDIYRPTLTTTLPKAWPPASVLKASRKSSNSKTLPTAGFNRPSLSSRNKLVELRWYTTDGPKATEEISAQIETMQATTNDAVLAINGITQTIARMSDITLSISSAVEEQSAATSEIARNIQSVAAGSSEIRGHIGSVSTAAAATGTAAGDVLTNARGLENQSDMLRTAVDQFLTKMRAT